MHTERQLQHGVEKVSHGCPNGWGGGSPWLFGRVGQVELVDRGLIEGVGPQDVPS